MYETKNIETDNESNPVMSERIPNQDILEAFGVFGEPALLRGGQDTCYRVENIVLKPTNNNLEASWIADINSNLVSDKFRVAKPARAKDGSWIFNGWTASEFLEGEHRLDHYGEAIEVSRNFHEALVGIPKPDWFDKKTDVFALSDRMAWGEIPIPDFDMINKPFKKIFDLLNANRLPNQLVHGDWGPDQILFHGTLTPAVLDMTPYFRPANYPIADMLVSSLVDKNADPSILALGIPIANFDQLALRALIFRICTYVGFQIHPENDHDWTPVITKYLNTIDIVMKKTKK